MDTYVKQFMRMLGAGLYDILTILYFRLLVYMYTIFPGACGAHSSFDSFLKRLRRLLCLPDILWAPSAPK